MKKKRQNKKNEVVTIKNSLDNSKNIEYEIKNNDSNTEKKDEDIKASNINKNEINDNKLPVIEEKINEGISSKEEDLKNNNQSSNPYDLPDDF